MPDATVRGAPLTEEELGRIATEHVEVTTTIVPSCEVCDVPWPCLVSRLYALVLRQSALMAAWGLPCSCDPDFDLEAPP